VSVANVEGVESMFMNIAGLANTKKTEVIFSNTQWLVGAGININNFGFAQKVGNNGVLGMSFMAFDYGEWEVTTAAQPEGTGGTISPSTLNINLGYSQKFTASIRGGVNVKLYSSQISNLSTFGLAFDAGVQYWTGDEDKWKFGITLRNIGPSIDYGGDGQDIALPVPTFGVAYSQSFQGRSAQFELPTQLRLGASYDFLLPEEQKITVAAQFTSNSFQKDNYHIGLQYSMKKYLSVRAGYVMEDNRVDDFQTSAMNGFSAGLSFDVPLTESGTVFGLSYAYRSTRSYFSGVHTIGARISL
ncbi:MAG: PorV/PorQ family protein, partial [Bacteroidota bacterium]|nr:PorV/PorQ family protein [Bacteroidota bacterium]